MRQLFKNWGIPLIIISILHFTGLLSDIMVFGQSLLLKTGIKNVTIDETKLINSQSKEFIDYDQKLIDQNGLLITLEKFKGKVLFINIWASWCAPCKAEMPDIDELYKKLKKEPNIQFIMLSVDQDKSRADRFMSNNKFQFPYFHWSGDFTEKFRVPNIPTTYIIDKDGQILAEYVGMNRYNTGLFRNYLKRKAAK